MKSLRSLILMVAMTFSCAPFANTLLSDMSDLWWIPTESGWGVTVTHQGDIAFLTFFIYGQDGKAAWYTGQAAYTGKNSGGAYIFTGPVYQVAGPWFGTSTFNPNLVTVRQAGTVTFTAFLNAATLAYAIDGVSVTKNVVRQTFRNNDMTGDYMGAMKSTQSGCRSLFDNGDFNDSVEYSVTSSATNFSMRVTQLDRSTCTYTGNYVQSGRFGSSEGTYTCTRGATGTYQVVELEAGISGFTGRYAASDNFCTAISGRFAAMRK